MDCLRKWFLVPSFAILVAFSFFFSMLFIIGSMSVADLCVDSPDNRILTILERFQEQLSPIAVEIASFYINGTFGAAAELNCTYQVIPPNKSGLFSSLIPCCLLPLLQNVHPRPFHKIFQSKSVLSWIPCQRWETSQL
jgi:hypothetical protein